MTARTSASSPVRPGQSAADCPHFPVCPGCPWIGRAYDRQLGDKRQIVVSALDAAGIAHSGVEILPVAAAPAHHGYRVQAKLMVAASRCGPVLGLYRSGTHRVADVSGCPLHDPLLQRAIPIVREALGRAAVPIHGGGRPGVRYVLLRTSVSEQRLLVTLVTSRVPLAAAPHLARDLRSRLPLAGLLLNENRSRGNVILGARITRVWGATELSERYGEVVLGASPLAFVQGNTHMAARIYTAIAAAAALSGRERVVDLYCGVGGIALTLAPAAGEVLGIEEVEAAVTAARANARRNRRRNTRFAAGRVEVLVRDAARGADLVTLNPPRRGCGASVTEALAASRVPRILYLSCSAASFARDAAALARGRYRLRRVHPFDLLPQTDHVELLGHFERAP